MDDEGEREAVVARFREWIMQCPDLLRMVRRQLRGKTLGCWCAPRECHADVLASIAADESISAEDPVLVFGSNRSGRHGRGAAAFAAAWRGAEPGQGVGRAGRSYAIPTKDESLTVLPVEAIASEVSRFLDYAREHADTDFDVTAIGCGLSGYADEAMAPLFLDAPSNCRLPYRWQRLLNPALPVRVIVAGSRWFEDEGLMARKLDAFLERTGPKTTIVSGGARGADLMGEQYAISRGLPFVRVPAEWDRYGRMAAGPIRNQHMSFLASHLVAFWDGASPGTRGMVKIAKADRLELRVVKF